MPGPEPNWTDVVFDHAAAQNAAEACRAAARRLRTTNELRVGMIPSVVEDWVGRYRRDFDAATVTQHNDVEALADDLDRQALAIESAAAEARALQTSREADREAWRDSQEAIDGDAAL